MPILKTHIYIYIRFGMVRFDTASAAAAAAVAVCCHGFLKVALPEAANNHYEIIWASRKSALFWACRARVPTYLGFSFSLLFLLRPLFAGTKTHMFLFCFSDLVIW